MNMIPLYEFAEHNEAFYFWQKARYDGYLKKPLDLFHIDAHPDMNEAAVFVKSLYISNRLIDGYMGYYADIANNQLAIGNFILPAVLNGLVKNIYFIYPKWSRWKPARKKMNISSVLGEGKILKYNLKIEKSPNPALALQTLPDLKYFSYYAHSLEKIPRNRKAILDIDCDYFACRDSVTNNIDYELEITREQFLNKTTFLADKTIRFSELDFSFTERDGKYFVKIAYRKVKELSYLPPKKEIELEINSLTGILRAKKINPAVITISKSCFSGYCPVDYSEFIADKLKQGLKDLFGENLVYS